MSEVWTVWWALRTVCGCGPGNPWPGEDRRQSLQVLDHREPGAPAHAVTSPSRVGAETWHSQS